MRKHQDPPKTSDFHPQGLGGDTGVLVDGRCLEDPRRFGPVDHRGDRVSGGLGCLGWWRDVVVTVQGAALLFRGPGVCVEYSGGVRLKCPLSGRLGPVPRPCRSVSRGSVRLVMVKGQNLDPLILPLSNGLESGRDVMKRL